MADSSDNSNKNQPQQNIPYKRERTPSIVVQSLGLTFNQDSRLINESVDEPTNEDFPSTTSPSNECDDDHDQDDEGSAYMSDDTNSTIVSDQQLQQQQHHHQQQQQQQQQHSMIRQSTIAGTKSPPKTQASILNSHNNNNRRLSLNITNTRRQSLTVDGIGAFSTQPSPLSLASSGNATGSLRNKVALKPGHSLMGWIRLASTSKDLSGTNGKLLDVTPEELARHNTLEDCWVALKGNVYNVTLYLSYHPGGEEELMRAAGQDATDLFNEVHRWVNYESILAKCLVGRYKCEPFTNTSPVNNKQRANNDKEYTVTNRAPPRRQSIALTVQSPTKYQSLLLNNSLSASSNQIQQPPTYVISQDKASIKIKIQDITLDIIRSRNLICDLIDQTELQVSVILTNDWLYRVHLKLDQKVEGSIEFQLLGDEGCIVLNLPKKESVVWPKIGSSLDLNDSLCEMSLADKFFRPCQLAGKKQLTHDTYLYEFDFKGLMFVPVGWHVLLREYSTGKKLSSEDGSIDDYDYRVHKNYTPVSADLLENDKLIDESGFLNKLYFIIKVYPNGVLTPKINELKIGDNIDVSDYQLVDFDIEKLALSKRHWILFAAGTGFTPMVRVMSYLLSMDDEITKSVRLIFFNKTQKDIIWRHKLDKLKDIHNDRFHIEHVLSEEGADTDWTGSRGRITKEFVNKTVDGISPDELYILACGPRGFTQLTSTFVNDLNLGGNLFVFHG